MKASIIAAAAVLAAGVSATHAHHHGHQAFHNVARRDNSTEECGRCETIWITQTGHYTFVPYTTTSTTSTTTSSSTSSTTSSSSSSSSSTSAEVSPSTSAAPSTTPAPVPSSTAPVASETRPAPTPYEVRCPEPGVYKIPSVTITLTEYVTVCPPGTNDTVVYPPGVYIRPEVVTTVDVYDYVFYCPYTAAPKPEPTASIAAIPTPAPVVPTPEAVVTSSPAPVSSAPAKPKSGSGSLAVGNSGDQWAITYTPYSDGGQCKDRDAVSADIKAIASKGFTTVRIYSSDPTDCNPLENIGDACAANGLTLVLGIFIKNTGIGGAHSQIEALKTFKHWSIVALVVIGNEALMNNYCSPSELAGFITSCKTAFAAAGYTGPVTTTEPLSGLQQHASVLCPVIDLVGANIHPFFNSATAASSAGAFVAGQLAIVDTLCPGKQGINLECGWPSAGRCNGLACPGASEQAAALASIKAAVGGRSVVFSFANDPWKEPGEFGCEQHWGISQLY